MNQQTLIERDQTTSGKDTMTDTIRVNWITADGAPVSADVPIGHNLMEAAVANDVEGVIGDCGGSLACATCHVVVVETPNPIPEKQATEEDMLEFAEVPAVEGSRLSCQIVARPELDGIVLRVPTE